MHLFKWIQSNYKQINSSLQVRYYRAVWWLTYLLMGSRRGRAVGRWITMDCEACSLTGPNDEFCSRQYSFTWYVTAWIFGVTVTSDDIILSLKSSIFCEKAGSRYSPKQAWTTVRKATKHSQMGKEFSGQIDRKMSTLRRSWLHELPWNVPPCIAWRWTLHLLSHVWASGHRRCNLLKRELVTKLRLKIHIREYCIKYYCIVLLYMRKHKKSNWVRKIIKLDYKDVASNGKIKLIHTYHIWKSNFENCL